MKGQLTLFADSSVTTINRESNINIKTDNFQFSIVTKKRVLRLFGPQKDLEVWRQHIISQIYLLKHSEQVESLLSKLFPFGEKIKFFLLADMLSEAWSSSVEPICDILYLLGFDAEQTISKSLFRLFLQRFQPWSNEKRYWNLNTVHQLFRRPWFSGWEHSQINRVRFENSAPGTFTIRFSHTLIHCFALIIKNKTGITSFRISFENDNFILDGNLSFTSLDDLIKVQSDQMPDSIYFINNPSGNAATLDLRFSLNDSSYIETLSTWKPLPEPTEIKRPLENLKFRYSHAPVNKSTLDSSNHNSNVFDLDNLNSTYTKSGLPVWRKTDIGIDKRSEITNLQNYLRSGSNKNITGINEKQLNQPMLLPLTDDQIEDFKFDVTISVIDIDFDSDSDSIPPPPPSEEEETNQKPKTDFTTSFSLFSNEKYFQQDNPFDSCKLPNEIKNETSHTYITADNHNTTSHINFSDAIIKEFLGKGGSSTVVHRAYLDGLSCAVKILDTTTCYEHEIEIFQNEIKLMKSLKNCPNIVKYLHDDFKDNSYRLFMEFFPMTLQDIIIQQRAIGIGFSTNDIIFICVEVLKSIKFLHERNPPIAHRDVKAGNIFLGIDLNNKPFDVKLGDLGVSKEGDLFNTLIGTPNFMAPEISNHLYDEENVNLGYGASVDIFAFGFCIYQMVTLKDPFEEYEDPILQIHSGLTLSLPDETEPLISKIFNDCTQLRPDLRPKASQLLEILEEEKEKN